MDEPALLTAAQRARESSVILAVLMDAGIFATFLLVGLLGGSLTILAEAIRGGLMQVIELVSLIVMRRIHRGRLTGLEFGTGKLERAVNLLIAGGMLAGAAWIALGALDIASGRKLAGSPFGLAAAAVTGAVNTYINVLAWDAMRRAAQSGGSLIMAAQLDFRIVRLIASAVVLGTMTVAALSADAVVAVWADASGSIFVAGFMVVNAVGMLRAGIPDILDYTATRDTRAAIDRVLAAHRDDYRRLDRVRSRRSGEQVFIEVSLGFDAGLSVAEAVLRADRLGASLRREISEAEIAVLVAADPAG